MRVFKNNVRSFLSHTFLTGHERKDTNIQKKRRGAYATSAMTSVPQSKPVLAYPGIIPETLLGRAFPKEERTTKISKKNAAPFENANLRNKNTNL
jgi:hypothetical protein